MTQDEAEQLYWQADGKYDDCDYQGCLNDATTCLQAFTELGNKKWQGNCLSLIGLAHKKLGNYQEAEQPTATLVMPMKTLETTKKR